MALTGAERQRERRAPARIQTGIRRLVKAMEKELASVDADIDAAVRGSPAWCGKEDLLTSVPGIGPTIARTLLAARLPARERRRIAATAWDPKPQPTFSDARAAVRYAIWREAGLSTSRRRRDRRKPRLPLPRPWAYALCQAA